MDGCLLSCLFHQMSAWNRGFANFVCFDREDVSKSCGQPCMPKKSVKVPKTLKCNGKLKIQSTWSEQTEFHFIFLSCIREDFGKWNRCPTHSNHALHCFLFSFSLYVGWTLVHLIVHEMHKHTYLYIQIFVWRLRSYFNAATPLLLVQPV